MKLLHLNNISDYLIPSDLGPPEENIEIVPIQTLHPSAADVYQLYNLTADPEERVNLFYNKSHSLDARRLL